MRTLLSFCLLFWAAELVLAQGEDSTPWARDLQVIAQMLPGTYSNANQSYFDRRTDAAVKHRSFQLQIDRVAGTDLGNTVFKVTGFFDGDLGNALAPELWRLTTNDEIRAVSMQRWQWDRADVSLDQLGDAQCTIDWRREAQQFRAKQGGRCEQVFADEIVLSEQQLWFSLPNFDPTADHGDFRLHRARAFECYADIPGVGGGRDEPYDRYDGLKLHDQGGSAWFTSKAGRRLGISLLRVDWPINNYQGVFTRDSLVIYVSEQLAEEREELGYAFTEPTAERIGINLKWMLASCFMLSNEFATPSM